MDRQSPLGDSPSCSVLSCHLLPLLFRAAIKPTPSISKPQQTVNLETGERTTLQIKGRHDPCIVPRAVPVVEAAAAIAIFDAWLEFKARS